MQWDEFGAMGKLRALWSMRGFIGERFHPRIYHPLIFLLPLHSSLITGPRTMVVLFLQVVFPFKSLLLRFVFLALVPTQLLRTARIYECGDHHDNTFSQLRVSPDS